MRSEPENILQILAIDQGGKNGKNKKKMQEIEQKQKIQEQQIKETGDRKFK